MSALREELAHKLKTLTEDVWTGAVDWPMILDWLDNFAPDADGVRSERLHALFLLSQFMYFGSREMRELLRALFRDLYRYPIIEHLRRANADTLDCDRLNALFEAELANTRFLGIGNPSESGTHLLYYFRQENGLRRDLFANAHELFTNTPGAVTQSLAAPHVTRYVFLDDFCGSGTQAEVYSRKVVAALKGLDAGLRVSYYALFATTTGLAHSRKTTGFDEICAVYELDESFRCFGPASRYFKTVSPELEQAFAETMCRYYGRTLLPDHPLGYADGQLLIGFSHNVPDNTLPIIWRAPTDVVPWSPIFRRYPKLYKWGGV